MRSTHARIAILFVGIASAGCRRVDTQAPSPDLSFCAISEQTGKPMPALGEIETLTGRYRVALYSADSGKVLNHLDISLIPTDTVHRFYQRSYDSTGAYKWQRRKQPLLAYGSERQWKSEPNVDEPSLALYHNDKPMISIFDPPQCRAGGCVFYGIGMILNIKQVVKDGFAGTVDQIGVGTAFQAPGKPWQLVGPHFFCALKKS